MPHPTAVQNAGKLGAESRTRIQTQIDLGVRCKRCTIYVFTNADDALEYGVTVFDTNINLAVDTDEGILCVGCANGR